MADVVSVLPPAVYLYCHFHLIFLLFDVFESVRRPERVSVERLRRPHLQAYIVFMLVPLALYSFRVERCDDA